MSRKKKKDELNDQQILFIEKYLGDAHFNGTKAAEMAGYQGNKNTLGVTAYNLLRNPKIKDVLDKTLSAMTMPANVVLTRLTQIADGKVTDFYNEDGKFDLSLAKKNGKDHLIRKIKQKRLVRESKTETNEDLNKIINQNLDEDEIEILTQKTELVYEETEFELYSSHDALKDLGRHHKLFTDKTEIDANLNHSVDEETIKKVNKAYEQFTPKN